MSILYFAYGSNLNPSVHEGRLALVGPAALPGHQLAFNYRSSRWNAGALNLVPARGRRVLGALYLVDEDGWSWLDRKEGHPCCYERRRVTVQTPDGPVEAVTYVVRPERQTRLPIPPKSEYVARVREGLRLLGLSTDGLDRAVAASRRRATDAVFVYGILMRGECRHGCLGEPAELQCALLARAPGRLVDLGAYPGMVEAESPGDFVEGEYIRVGDIRRTLRKLDRIEGFLGFHRLEESLYRREQIEVDAGDGRIRPAWTYVYNGPVEGRPILSGNWRKHRYVWEPFLRELAVAHCQDREQEVAWEIAGRIPYAFQTDRRAAAGRLMPLWQALDTELLSERRLAQHSGTWAAAVPS